MPKTVERETLYIRSMTQGGSAARHGPHKQMQRRFFSCVA